MSRAALIALVPALLAGAAVAQPADPHAGHHMPAQPAAQPAEDPHAHHRAQAASPPAADPHAGHAMPETPGADPHAGHRAPQAEPADPHAGHRAADTPPAADPHAGHAMTGADLPVGDAPPPPKPADQLADAVWDRAAMDRSRRILALEHGGMRHTKVTLEQFELRTGSGPDALAFEGEVRHGGDVNRAVVKLEGEAGDGDLHEAEVQLLWSRAIGPYFDVQAGVRQDFEPSPRRTYAVAGFEGLAPYWFEVEGAVFLSDEGELSARFEGSYDLRLTQRLILQPSAEASLAAQDVPELGIGSGLADVELGLRLRYEVRREFAPYVGVHYERKFGDTADFARAAGEDRDETRVVAGVRIWF